MRNNGKRDKLITKEVYKIQVAAVCRAAAVKMLENGRLSKSKDEEVCFTKVFTLLLLLTRFVIGRDNTQDFARSTGRHKLQCYLTTNLILTTQNATSDRDQGRSINRYFGTTSI